MSRFASTGAQPPGARTMRAGSPGQTVGPALTHEGGVGAALDAKTALYQIGVTSMLGGSYYETADDTLARLVTLTRTVAAADPAWISRFVPWARRQGLLRTAPVVMAVEAADVMVKAGVPGGRLLVNTACQRADEPGEAVAYWIASRGSKAAMPSAIKRGVGDAMNRLLGEYTAAKYDSGRHAVRLGDALRICHPTPNSEQQADLYAWLIARRAGKDGPDLGRLPRLAARQRLLDIPVDQRREYFRKLNPGDLLDAGITHEFLAGWLSDGGGMDAEAWEKVLPAMGYMARLRNIRNIEAARVNGLILDQLAAYIGDAGNVARSRQFPFAFWTAFRAADSLQFGHPLEKAAEAACGNVPKLAGRSLALVDISGSMQVPLGGGRGRNDTNRPMRWETGAFFAAALAKANGAGSVDLVIFGNDNARLRPQPTILQTIAAIQQVTANGNVIPGGGRMLGHGTETWQAANAWHGQGAYDRTFVFSDMQAFPGEPSPQVTAKPLYLFDVGDHATTMIDLGRGVHHIGGFTDAAFRLPQLVEAGTSVAWDDLFAQQSSTGIREDGDG